MSNIKVEQKSESNGRWTFTVQIGQGKDITQHTITLSDSYYQKLCSGQIEPSELVRKSFEFLLRKEPRESILTQFDLPLIQHYFSDYEVSVKL